MNNSVEIPAAGGLLAAVMGELRLLDKEIELMQLRVKLTRAALSTRGARKQIPISSVQ